MTQALKYTKQVSKPGTAPVSKSVPSSVLLAWLNTIMGTCPKRWIILVKCKVSKVATYFLSRHWSPLSNSIFIFTKFSMKLSCSFYFFLQEVFWVRKKRKKWESEVGDSAVVNSRSSFSTDFLNFKKINVKLFKTCRMI